MELKASNIDISLGRNIGYKIYPTIKNAKKSIKVVSPYFSEGYIDLLLDLHKKGIQITLITSDDFRKYPEKEFRTFRRFIKQEKHINHQRKKVNKRGAILSFLFLIIIVLFTHLKLLPVLQGTILSVIAIVAGICFFCIKYVSYSYYPVFKVKIFNYLPDTLFDNKLYNIHAKIFVVDDDVAFLGSVNFTKTGFRSNYETIAKVTDRNIVAEISQEVDMLFYNTDLPHVDLVSIGKKIYKEPRF